jgi:hypothetical protein
MCDEPLEAGLAPGDGDPLVNVTTGRREGFNSIDRACFLNAAGQLLCQQPEWAGRRVEHEGPFSMVGIAFRHMCGLRLDQTLECWLTYEDTDCGYNCGQADVPAGEYVWVSVGSTFSCGMHPGGTTECWGEPPQALSESEYTVTVEQARQRTTACHEMPSARGWWDYVLPARSMPVTLARYLTQPYINGERAPSESIQDNVEAIIAVLRAQTKHDFRHYKAGTLVRRGVSTRSSSRCNNRSWKCLYSARAATLLRFERAVPDATRRRLAWKSDESSTAGA